MQTKQPATNTALIIRISVIQLAIGIWDEIMNSTLQNVLVSGFSKSETFKGTVIAASQLLTILLLPLWGALSDRCKSKFGRRTPFIVTGGFVCAAFLAGSVLFYEQQNLTFFLLCIFAGAIGICMVNPAATALVPDLTPKHRNAHASVINRIVCSLGGAWVVLLILIFNTDFTVIYLVSAGTVLNCTLFYIFAVRENKLREQQKDILNLCNGPSSDEKTSLTALLRQFSQGEKKSFFLILAANFFAKFAYYAFSSAYLNYAVAQWGMQFSHTGLLTFGLYLAGLFSILFTARIADRLGRKTTLLLSYIFMFGGFAVASLTDRFGFTAIVSLLFIGIGWSMESVLPLPMLMELSGSGTVGIITSVYTDSCKLGRVTGPFLAGLLCDRTKAGYKALYPLSAVTMLPALLCTPFIRHGNVRTPAQKEVAEDA